MYLLTFANTLDASQLSFLKKLFAHQTTQTGSKALPEKSINSLLQSNSIR